MECELCGKKANKLYSIKVEGVILQVCERCARRYGIFIGKVSAHSDNKKHEKMEEVEKVIVDDFYKKIREARIKRALTQEDVAKQVGISLSLYKKIEQGKVVPDERTARKLERFFGIKLYTEMKLPSGKREKKEEDFSLTLGDVAILRKR